MHGIAGRRLEIDCLKLEIVDSAPPGGSKPTSTGWLSR